jgi:hypothetical protein
MKKKYLGYALGVAAAAALTAGNAFAQSNGALTGEDLFGGADSQDFASAAGLASGSLPNTIAAIIRTILGFLGIVAVVIILMGGFKWMTAGGNDDKVKEAKRLIVQGIIGLVITLSAFAIASFVITSITGAVGSAA